MQFSSFGNNYNFHLVLIQILVLLLVKLPSSLELDCYICGTEAYHSPQLEVDSPESCKSFESDFSWAYHSVTCGDDYLCVKIISKMTLHETLAEDSAKDKMSRTIEQIHRGCTPKITGFGRPHQIGCGESHLENVQMCFCENDYCNSATQSFVLNIFIPILASFIYLL